MTSMKVVMKLGSPWLRYILCDLSIIDYNNLEQ